MRAVALPAIRFYQRRISPHKGFCCAYRSHLGRDSCSELGLRAIRRYGFLKGIGVLQERLKLCGVTYRRHLAKGESSQRGSAPCDIPCDCSVGSGCDLPSFDCKGVSRYVSCCDACSCDWPDRKKKKDYDKYVYIPPARRRARRE
jgi:putative component of membrane protein insertase Oxa1/YidC/SpoIIIJ protein YidD